MLLQLILTPLGWLKNSVSVVAEDALLATLSAGPIPQHVAFILDGNRRYARSKDKQVNLGHTDGFYNLKKMLEVCIKMKVRCVSAYAFSIENFKRSPGEVEALMDLAEQKLLEFCEQGSILEQYGIKLVVVGHKDMLPERVRAAAEKAEALTAHHDRAIFNLCMPYTSRDEMTTAVQTCIQECLVNESMDSKISAEDIDAHLMTSLAGSPPLDILIRTSGVKRLSDYLLWQCSEDTQLQFSNKYWPEFGMLDFVPIILDYQRKAWAQAS
ncbi:Di-trans-poly-cis-decaprenylcistransferase [Epithele typhae]|uniref:Di-trans-poly-cis-decaprenylcistransferase n=1 Tax=Epithele typhae TaxID=378194 RepID=UPI0020078998|nr:Di-trans-poly-cis-decaprenylcistransferase [Epithele typhae]KAH9945932.1 Di-trans-poly-cis-decaprenylcistransferase [Epithele typhae]